VEVDMGTSSEDYYCEKCKTNAPGVRLRFELRNYKADISSSSHAFPGLTSKQIAFCNKCVNKERFFDMKINAGISAFLISFILIAWFLIPKSYPNLVVAIVIISGTFLLYTLKSLIDNLTMTKKTANHIRSELAEESLSELTKSFGDGFYYELIE
jgi:hypothetical protein